MKRRLITRILLSLAVVLTALQANAQNQLKVRLFADTSGLAKGTAGSDSFPYAKSELYSWFSVKPDGSGIYLRPGKSEDAKIKAEAQADLASVFKVDFAQSGDSTKFKITPLNGANPLSLQTTKGEVTPFFRILDTADVSKAGDYRTLLDAGGGYLVYDPGIANPRLDTVQVALVGADRNGNLSLRYFNEFAIYGILQFPGLCGFQYGEEYDPVNHPGKKFDPSKLYGSNSFPWFQIYDKEGNNLIKYTEPVNWGHLKKNSQGIPGQGAYVGKANPNDTAVYSWINIKLVGDSTVRLHGYTDVTSRRDTVATVRLDSIVNWVHAGTWKEGGHSGFGVDTTTNEYIIWDSISEVTGTSKDSIVYLKNDNGQLSFTVRTDSQTWTNGAPDKFTYGDKKVYYIIDLMMDIALRDSVYGKVFGIEVAKFIFWQDTRERYLYKYDDGWRPLYIKAEQVSTEEAKKTYEYVGTQWVKENNFDIGSALQEAVVTGVKDHAISDANDGAMLVAKDSPEAARFIFEFADTISKDDKHWFKKAGSGITNKGRFRNTEDVELFRIKYEKENAKAKYLTVLDTIEFGNTQNAYRNAVGWDTLLNDARGSVLQLFAIARNYLDSSVTFLPVAAPRWHTDDKKTDTLTFNLGIGKKEGTEVYVNLTNNSVWHLESYLNKLIVTDSFSTAEPIRFKLSSTLIPWEGPAQGGHVASVQQKRTGKYYRVDSSFVDRATADDIRTHWRVVKDSTDDKTPWKFVPVTYVQEFEKHSAIGNKPLSVFKYDDEYVVLQNNLNVLLDTVKVEYNINLEDFRLFGKLDDVVAGITFNSGKSKVAIQNDNKYIAFPAVHADSTFAVTFKQLDSSEESLSAITVHSSDTVYLNKTDSLYPVHYYMFSYKAGGKDYYLKANKDSVQWVHLEKAASKTDTFKFSLPFDKDKQKVYLLDKVNQVIAFNGDGSGLTANKAGDNIYEVSDELTKGIAALKWTLHDSGSEAVEEWVHIASIDSVGGTATGVLRSADFAGRVVAAESSNKYGFLSNSADVKLTFKQSRASERVSTDPTYYYIIVDETYSLTEVGSDIVFAADGKLDFAFAKVKDSDNINIVSIGQDEDHYLTIKGLNQYRLAFTPDREDALSFELEIDETHTGIQVTGASSAKVYGVAGGVKVANASGAVAIYAIDGRLVTAQAVTSPNQTIAVPAGIYIVRNGAEVTKVIVK